MMDAHAIFHVGGHVLIPPLSKDSTLLQMGSFEFLAQPQDRRTLGREFSFIFFLGRRRKLTTLPLSKDLQFSQTGSFTLEATSVENRTRFRLIGHARTRNWYHRKSGPAPSKPVVLRPSTSALRRRRRPWHRATDRGISWNNKTQERRGAHA